MPYPTHPCTIAKLTDVLSRWEILLKEVSVESKVINFKLLFTNIEFSFYKLNHDRRPMKNLYRQRRFLADIKLDFT